MTAPHFSPGRFAINAHARPRVAVVGAGIVGLAHAWSAARRGYEVLLFERNRLASGASVRNFGMIWPIGQPNGPLHRAAMDSRRLWQELLSKTGMWHSPCGSLHLAYRCDELDVLTEFSRIAPPLGYECQWLSPDAVLAKSPAVRSDGLLGALWSANEICVDPREVIAAMPKWLESKFAVKTHFETPIDRVAGRTVATANGDRWLVDGLVVAAGADFRTLYPDLFASAGFRRCKLQMMRTAGQPAGWRLGPMLAGGLTLRHYDAFSICRSLPALKQRIADETPELNQYGVHVMAAQNGAGEVILGDSHEYDDDVTPFDKSTIEQLILRELRRMIDLPDWNLDQRWHGVYLKAPDTVQFVAEPDVNVRVVIASGGCGMTMSFGLAEELWSRWDRPLAGDETDFDDRRSKSTAYAVPSSTAARLP